VTGPRNDANCRSGRPIRAICVKSRRDFAEYLRGVGSEHGLDDEVAAVQTGPEDYRTWPPQRLFSAFAPLQIRRVAAIVIWTKRDATILRLTG